MDKVQIYAILTLAAIIGGSLIAILLMLRFCL